MTIDTEGSETEIVEDFPWSEFDVRVVQIEQLMEHAFPAQKGKRERIIRQMLRHGYGFLSDFPVDNGRTTQDLIFSRNVDEFLAMTEHSTKRLRSTYTHERKVANDQAAFGKNITITTAGVPRGSS